MKIFFPLFILIMACAITKAQAPLNDDPCHAVELMVNAVCNYQTFTNENATASQGVPLPECANYAGGDVWFKVTVPATGALIFDTQQGVISDGGMAVYTGVECSNLTLLDCNDDASVNGAMPALTISNQPPGRTLWVRFWEYDNDSPGTFGICVTNVQPPSNDDPCNAIPLMVNTVCNYETFTTANASASLGIPLPECAGYTGGDVWFKVTMPPTGILLFDSQEGVITDGGLAVYTGTDCGNLTLLNCDEDGSVNGAMPALTISNQPPGSTLWIRFWEYGNDDPGTFGICVRNVQLPSNDDPCNATPLTVSTVCNYQTFTTEDATASQGVQPPQCANYTGGDVWFKVTVPEGGALVFDSETGVITDGGMALYTGTDCNNLTLLDCDDDGSVNGTMPYLNIGSQPPGSTIWIRFWEYGNNNPGTFGICVKIPSPLVPGFTYAAYPVNQGTVVQFTDLSAAAWNDPVVSWRWAFDDGTTSTLQNPVHYYPTPGRHSATLTIKTSTNDSGTKVNNFELVPGSPQIQEINLCPSIDNTQLFPVLTGDVFQWQMSTDSVHFSNISDDSHFSGANTTQLVLTNIPSAWYGYLFRCRSNDGYYTWPTSIKFTNEFKNTTGGNWEDPSNWSCGRLPDENTDVTISGIATLNSTVSCRSLHINPGAAFTISMGYTLTVTH